MGLQIWGKISRVLAFLMCLMLWLFHCNVGSGREEFTIEIHHGGFFVGFGHLRLYGGEKLDWFDSIEIDTWSPLWFEDFLQQLRYQNDLRIKFYWLLPGRTLADGLRIIASNHDTNVMALVIEKCKTLVVYVDHEASRGDCPWDDVVGFAKGFESS